MIKVGFIGLGNMGMPMALNLHKSKKIDLLGYDVSQKTIQKFKSKKAKATNSLKELINFSDIIISCVPGPKQIKLLSVGKNKIIDQLDKNKVWIDCSTNSLSCFNFLKKKLKRKINQFVDATISGGNLKAQSGDLSIFVGGQKKTVNKLKFIFNILGKNLYYLNTAGAGYAAKIAQVSLCYLNYLSLSESLMLGASAGVFSIVAGSATLLPNYTFYLLFLGPVRIKYIALFYILLSFLDVTGSNAGGEIAHLGGAMIGYLFIRQLQNGVNIGEGVINIVNFFNKEKNKKSDQKSSPTEETKYDISQDEIDKILDKISESGYSSLSKNEKEKLFNASKK